MKEEIRRVIAYAAASQILGKTPSSIYSYSESKYVHMSKNYDYEAGAHIITTGKSLYHYGLSAHISFSINGNKFSGYDYESGSHFQGTATQRNVQIYDYGEGSYFSYQV